MQDKEEYKEAQNKIQDDFENELMISEDMPCSGKDTIEDFIGRIGNMPQAIPTRTMPMLSKKSRFLMPSSLAVIGGTPGSAKSFFSLQIGLNCMAEGVKWAYLPLEKNRDFHLMRMACVISKSWDCMPNTDEIDGSDADKERLTRYLVKKAQDKMYQIKDILDLSSQSIFNNPCLPDENGIVKDASPKMLIHWIKTQADNGVKVVMIDPFAMVNFSGRDAKWKAEEDFVKDLVTISSTHKICIVFVCHTTKKVEGKVTESDLQGSASIGRLADSIIIIQDLKNSGENSNVLVGGEFTKEVSHNRLIHLAKTRNGTGKHESLAFHFGKDGANFEELGIIAPDGLFNPAPSF